MYVLFKSFRLYFISSIFAHFFVYAKYLFINKNIQSLTEFLIIYDLIFK